MLGHASAAMTLDVYAGLFGDDLDTVADLLDGPHAGVCGLLADSEWRRARTAVRGWRGAHAVSRGSLRAREENRTPDLRITSLVHGERTYG
jgi:hypothetical protein